MSVDVQLVQISTTEYQKLLLAFPNDNFLDLLSLSYLSTGEVVELFLSDQEVQKITFFLEGDSSNKVGGEQTYHKTTEVKH